ncbi:MAG: DUF2726 domain-containing protein [Deltaproteobacteria bacterium]|jgi:hypothetical protein|nr:DUF2726 domain-containing protein [Deltaproteobacteria bacterium]
MDAFFALVSDIFGQGNSSKFTLAGGAFLLVFVYLVFRKLRPQSPKKKEAKPGPAEGPVSDEMVVDKKMARLAAKAAKEAKKKAKAAAKLAAKHKGKLPAQAGPGPAEVGQPSLAGPAEESVPSFVLPLPAMSPSAAQSVTAEAAPLLALAASPVPEALASPAPGNFKAVQLKAAQSGPVLPQAAQAPGPAFQFAAPHPQAVPVGPGVPEASPAFVWPAQAPPALTFGVTPQDQPSPVFGGPAQATPAPQSSTPISPQPAPLDQAIQPQSGTGVRIASGGQTESPPVPDPPLEEAAPADGQDAPVPVPEFQAPGPPAEKVPEILELEPAAQVDEAAPLLEVESVPDHGSPGEEARKETVVQTSPLPPEGPEAPLPEVPGEEIAPSPEAQRAAAPPILQAKPMSILESRGGVLKASKTQMATPIQIDQTQLPRVMKEAVASSQPDGVATVTVQELEVTYQRNIFLSSLEIVYYKLLRAAFTQFLIFPKVTSRAAVTVISRNPDHLKVAENVLSNTALSFVVCDVKLNIRAIVEVVDEAQPASNRDRARDYILKKAGLVVVRFYSGDTPPDVATLRKLLAD